MVEWSTTTGVAHGLSTCTWHTSGSALTSDWLIRRWVTAFSVSFSCCLKRPSNSPPSNWRATRVVCSSTRDETASRSPSRTRSSSMLWCKPRRILGLESVCKSKVENLANTIQARQARPSSEAQEYCVLYTKVLPVHQKPAAGLQKTAGVFTFRSANAFDPAWYFAGFNRARFVIEHETSALWC